MSGKVYILNTKMTSSVYIKMMQLLNFITSSYTIKRSNCLVVERGNLDTIAYNKNTDMNFLICGREIKKGDVISFLENMHKIKREDIIVIDIPHYSNFDDIMGKYGFTNTKISFPQRNFLDYYLTTLNNNEYYTDLCYEFFYTFVKPIYSDLDRPKVEIFEEMQGFLHIKNSVYKTVSDKIFQSKFYKKTKIFNDKLAKYFLPGFGGLSIYSSEMICALNNKNYNLNEYFYWNIYDRYINFLIKSKCCFGLYYDDRNNTCYVIKNVSKDLKEDFSYKTDNRQYSYMNCINVPNWLYNTPSNKLDAKRILSIKNVDVRTLAIKKLGISNLIQYGKVIDSWENYPDNEWWEKSEYKLIDMNNFVPPIKIISSETKKVLGTKQMKYAPFLCMKNQTTREYHLEGVSPKCKNLYDALKMRYKGLNLPAYEIKDIK